MVDTVVVVEKRYYGHAEVSQAYGIGRDAAYRVIREIRASYPDGHPLPGGKIFASDLAAYEAKLRAKRGGVRK